jgi:hypothetical protein
MGEGDLALTFGQNYKRWNFDHRCSGHNPFQPVSFKRTPFVTPVKPKAKHAFSRAKARI